MRFKIQNINLKFVWFYGRATCFICCGFAENYKQYFEKNISKELLEKAITYDTFGEEIILEKQKALINL